MSYYLKISYKNKMKKFIVRDPKQINICEIKNIFVPPIPSNVKLAFEVTYQNEEPSRIKCQKKLLDYFLNREFAKGDSVRIKMEEISSESKEESDQQFYQEFSANNKMYKIRSKSEELDSNLITNEFCLKSTEEYLYQSMRVSSSLIKQAEDYIHAKERELQKLKEEKRQTNLMEIVEFLYRRKS